MKKILSIIFIISTLLTPLTSYGFSPKIKELKSADGDKIWIIEEHSLPVISISIVFKKAGASYDSRDKSGIAYMLSNLLDEGSGKFDSIQFKKQLEDLAINMSFDVDKDNFYIKVKTLSENRERAFELLGAAITTPQLDAESARRVKNQMMAELDRKKQDPRYVANLAWNNLYFGKHPYSQTLQGTEESIPAIRRRDLMSFLKEKFVRANMVVSVVGDINEEETKRLAYEYLYILPKESPNLDTISHHNLIQEFTEKTEGGFNSIAMPIPQSTVIFGFKGLKYKDQDFYSLYVLNYILGGGDFESRLMKELREKRGLTYSIYTYIANFDRAPMVKGYLGTKNESVSESISLLKEEITKLKEGGITEEELQEAKNYLMGSFFLNLDTNQNLADFLTFMQIEDLGIDFLEKRNDYIKNVTISDVNRVASMLLDADNLVISVAGKE